MPDPDLEIRGGRSSRPLDKGGGRYPKIFFWPFGSQFRQKMDPPLIRLSVGFLENTVIDMHTLQLSPSNCHPIMVRRERVLLLGIE